MEQHNGDRPAVRLKEFFESLAEEAEEFTRRKPLEGLLLSFVAGLVLGELLRRPR
jgi:ElaB/YqjD/DUF883 family membrane-anchored ribosome-binding protein